MSESTEETHAEETRRGRLRELAGLFFWLGTTAFGGPAAHIALMQQEVVVRRKWVTEVEFLDMYAATNFIPGPNSTEMAIHLGYRRAGFLGLLVAGSCFIFPAAILCMGIAALYMAYGKQPISEAILYGVKPVVIAVVVQALFRLGKSAVKGAVLAVMTGLAMAALFLGVNELLVLFGTGVVTAVVETMGKRRTGVTLPMLALPVLGVPGAATGAATAAASASAGAGVVSAPLMSLFLVFLKIGSVLFGSGYVLLAFLHADFVERNPPWLTERTLLDAIAVGQITPGPVFTTATFIGYVTSGPLGAVVATVGIFLPAFFFVAVSAPLLPRLRKSRVAGAFLDGLNVASLGLMAVVTVALTRAAMVDWVTVLLAVLSLVLLVWKKVNSVWVVLGGAVIGIARMWWMG